MPIHINPSQDFPHLYAILAEHLPDRFHRTGRKLNPARVIGLLCRMCTMGQKGYRRVISEMKDGLRYAFGWVMEEDVPTPQAFGKARAALTDELCDQAFDAVYAACSTPRRRQAGTYRGLRVVAIDGTKLTLPISDALIAEFGVPKNQRGAASAPQAGLVQLWDVGANQPVGFSLTGCDYSERDQARDLFTQLGPGDVLVGDRGYPSHQVFADLSQRGVDFVIRCPVGRWREVTDFAQGSRDDAQVTWTKRDQKGRLQPGSTPITMRLIRTVLPNGTVEVIATSLMADEHPAQDVIGLYRARWRVETAFREMKIWHALEDFSALFVNGIRQEVMAIQIFMLLAGELEARAHAYHQSKHTGDHEAQHDQEQAPVEQHATSTAIRFNRRMIADAAVRLAFHGLNDLENLERRTLSNLREIWRQRAKRRPNRSYPRKGKRKPAQKAKGLS